MDFLHFTGKVFLSLVAIWFIWYFGSVIIGTVIRWVWEWRDSEQN